MFGEETNLTEFKASLAGSLIQAGDPDYDEARKVYNGMIDRRPRLIVRCADVADVVAAVNFGRQHKMLIAIRGGGHNAAGLGVCDDGLVIDLSLINYTRVNPGDGTVRVGGGCTWHAVDHLRSRGSDRVHFHHGRWRADPRWGHWASDPQTWTDD